MKAYTWPDLAIKAESYYLQLVASANANSLQLPKPSKGIAISNSGNVACYIAFDTTATTSNGFYLNTGATLSFEFIQVGTVSGVTGITGATWTASTAYAVGNQVNAGNGFIYKCTTAGTSGTSAPTWSTTVGATTTDGSVVWTTLGSVISIMELC